MPSRELCRWSRFLVRTPTIHQRDAQVASQVGKSSRAGREWQNHSQLWYEGPEDPVKRILHSGSKTQDKLHSRNHGLQHCDVFLVFGPLGISPFAQRGHVRACLGHTVC